MLVAEVTVWQMPLKTLAFRQNRHGTSVTWGCGPWSAIQPASWSSNQKQSNGDEEKSMRKQKGFSLIELLIVVAIILIIAAIAIPNLLRARIAANESSAVASIRTVNTAMISYNSSYPTVGFAANLLTLGGTCTGTTVPTSTSACLIDSTLAAGTKSGYTFVATASGTAPVGSYYAYGNPITSNSTGVRSFCSVQDAVVRVTGTASTGGCAGTEPPLQ
jgi:type IV pilus assembly protein PilA